MHKSVPALTTLLALGLAAAALTASPAAAPKPPAPSPATIAHAKTLVASKRCSSCHAANLTGRKGFSPSLHASGVMREYNPKTWARVMDTGVTNDNGHVKPPMPVYHLKAADSNALYAYLATLK